MNHQHNFQQREFDFTHSSYDQILKFGKFVEQREEIVNKTHTFRTQKSKTTWRYLWWWIE